MPRPSGAGGLNEVGLTAAVAQRLAGYAEADAVRRAELRALTDEEGAAVADELLQLLASLPEEPDRGSGLVEQQRIFAQLRE